jgi:hypothetical protein
MGKRVSNGSASAAAPKRKGRKDDSAASSGSAADLADLAKSSEVQGAISKFPWFEDFLDLYYREMESHGSASAVLDYYLPDTVAKMEWAELLHSKFPDMPGVPYMTEWSGGRTYIRGWMMAWHPQSGNKGFIYTDALKDLMTLIVAKGFQSDPNIPGVQVPVITPPNKTFFLDSEFVFPELVAGLVGVGGVHHTKNYTRAVAYHLALFLIHRMGRMDDFIASMTTEVFQSFCTIHANYVLYDDASAQIDANRGARDVYNMFFAYADICPLTTQCAWQSVLPQFLTYVNNDSMCMAVSVAII